MITSRISACITGAACAVGLMLSPEALMLHGNSAGFAGRPILWIIALAFIVHLCIVFGYSRIFDLYPGPKAEPTVIKEAWGPLPALLIPLASKLVLFAFLSTGLLVTAGFVFNEVFVYWFPNFAFAALLLVILLIVNLLGRSVALWSQVVFTVAALLCLVVLCIAADAPAKALVVSDAAGSRIPSALFLGLLVFLGYDLAGYAGQENNLDSSRTRTAMIGGMAVVFIVFLLWNRLSITHVSLGRLSDTTIPHILVARALLGQTGRILIGLVALFGTCAAVNALLYCTTQMIRSMSELELIPSFPAGRFARIPVAPVLLALCPGGMMALGLAGTPELDIVIRAGLWYWLLGYGAVHLSLLVLQKRPDQNHRFADAGFNTFLSVISMCAVAIALWGVLETYAEPFVLLKYLVWIGLGAFVISMISIQLRKITG